MTAFEKLLTKVVSMAREQGVRMGPIHAEDSTHSVADLEKQRRSQHKHHRPPHDPNAARVVKHDNIITGAKWHTVKRTEHFQGYTANVVLPSGPITSILQTSGAAADGDQLPKPLHKDQRQAAPAWNVLSDYDW